MIVSYDESGRIYASLDAGYPAQPEALALSQEAASGGVIDVPPFNDSFWHVVDGEIRIRPRLTVATEKFVEDLDSIVRLTGIPAGVTVYINGPEPTVEVVTDDDPLEIAFRTPGEYRVEFDPFPFQGQVIIINVEEQGS